MALDTTYIMLLTAWNNRDAKAMSALFSDTATMIGFDGSLVLGRAAIEEHLKPIFSSHPTASYVTIIRSTDAGLGLLRADVGMIPPGHTAVKPETLARQILVAREGTIDLFQNTPARLDEDAAGRKLLLREISDAYDQRGNFPR